MAPRAFWRTDYLAKRCDQSPETGQKTDRARTGCRTSPDRRKDLSNHFTMWAEEDKDIREALKRFYIETGLAQGDNEAALLLRRIYDQARDQSAKLHR